MLEIDIGIVYISKLILIFILLVSYHLELIILLSAGLNLVMIINKRSWL